MKCGWALSTSEVNWTYFSRRLSPRRIVFALVLRQNSELSADQEMGCISGLSDANGVSLGDRSELSLGQSMPQAVNPALQGT